MRRLLFATAACTLIAGAASAQNIIVSPIQDNPSTTVTATTDVKNASTSGPTYINATAASNVFNAEADAGTIIISPANNYSPNQVSYAVPTATVNLTNDAIAGATIGATALGNDMSLSAINVTTTGNQTSTQGQTAAVNIHEDSFTAPTVVTAEAAGNVLSVNGTGSVIIGQDTGVYATQSIDSTETATLKAEKFNASASFNGSAVAIGNDVEVTGSSAVTLSSLQALGNTSGSGANSIGAGEGGAYNTPCVSDCYPGSTQTATLVVSQASLQGAATLSASAVGNNLNAVGSSIGGTFQQNGTNATQVATATLSNVSFTGGLNVGTQAIGNSVSLKTH